MHKEKNIEKAIIRSLRARGIFCEKQESGKVFGVYKGRKYVIQMQREGVPDIIACVPTEITQDMVGKKIGVFYGIEVKRCEAEEKKWRNYDHTKVFGQKGYNKGIQDQKTRRDEILNSHGRFILTSSLLDVQELGDL